MIGKGKKMAFKKFSKVAFAVLMAVALIISVSPICAFAADDEVTDAVSDTVAVTEAVTDTETSADAASETEAPAETETSAIETETAAADTNAETSGEETTPADSTDDTKTDEKKGVSTGTIVSLAIVLVIVIAAAVYCIKNKEKVAKFFREVKSELKKIVWTPWSQVKKNTFVVLVIVIICAAAIGALDYLFSKGIFALGRIF